MFLSADQGESNFNVEILPGFDGFYALNSWMPLTALVDTRLDSFSGRIEIKIPYGDLYTGLDSFYSVSRDIFLIGDQQKAFYFTLPVLQAGVLEICIYENNELVFSQDYELQTVNNNSHQLLIPGQSTDFDFLRQYSIEGKYKYQTNYIHPDFLPESFTGYNLIDSVIIHNITLDALSEIHSNALHSWIRNGGNLFITGSITHSGDLPSFFSNIIPVSIIGPVFSDLSSSEWFLDINTKDNKLVPVTRTKVRTGSKVILEAGGIPIIVSREAGYGNIYYISINPGDSIFKNWDNREIFWDYVFSIGRSKLNIAPVINPLPELNKLLLSEKLSLESFNISKFIYIIFPLIIFLLLIFFKRVNSRVLLIIILIYPIIWSSIIIIFLTPPSPYYFETEIISSTLNNNQGHLFTVGTFAVHDPGLYQLQFAAHVDFILPDNSQNINIKYSGMNPVINYQMDSWSKRSFYLSAAYFSNFRGTAYLKGNSVIVDINYSRLSGLKNPIITYRNKFTDNFILLNEKNKLYLSFDIYKDREESAIVTSKYPEYFLDFLSYLKEADFLKSISDRESIVLVMEVDDFVPLFITKTAISENKTFFILEIPLKELFYEE